MRGLVISLLLAGAAHAEEPLTEPTQAPTSAAPTTIPGAPTATPVPKVSPSPRLTESPPTKRIYREKEAEGSEARNRFTTDPVVKSQYRVNGQALEVDPD